jgi:indole-3-glycerol phosphate synthase
MILFYILLILCTLSTHQVRAFKGCYRPKMTKFRLPLQMRQEAYAAYLERMVERKKIEVDNLLRRHQAEDDPLVMRMSYMASENLYNVTKSLQVEPLDDDGGLRRMSVTVDLKRKSPTVSDRRNIVEFSNAPKFAELLAMAGSDAFLINTDDVEYGGRPDDLKSCSDTLRLRTPADEHPPACIHKDIIIHPVQIAQALERGAAGVLLIVAVVGADLEVLLDACTVMGVEPLVEVHTPNELEFALSRGATIFLVNNWDRTTGELFRDQAKGLSSMMPMNAVAIAAGDIRSVEEAAEFGFYGYDGVVLGRGLSDIPDVQQYMGEVHGVRAPPRGMGMGMKGLPFKG